MLAAHLGGKPAVIAGVARIVVIADFIFTATAVVVQPITGSLLARTSVIHSGKDGWIAWSIVLYVVMGALWLPVVWMQMRLRTSPQSRNEWRGSAWRVSSCFLLWFRQAGRSELNPFGD